MTRLLLIVAYLVRESIINLVFHIVSRKLKSDENRWLSVFKGVLERIFIVAGLLLGYPQVIIAFGALKIGTRFQGTSRISNDYFLIGHLSLFLPLCSSANWLYY